MLVRLQKIIAERGYCSRRKAEELIASGKVKVNGKTIDTLGEKFEEDVHIVIDGKEVKANDNQELVYVVVNKPLGFISTAHDDRGRKEVTRLVPSSLGRLYPVGRLDINTSGLIILTNDGDFANLVTHPSSNFEKTYRVRTDGKLSSEEIFKLTHGVMLEDGLTAPAKLKEVMIDDTSTVFDLTIHEGRNRQVRRMVEAVNHKTISLKRIQIGPIKLDNLKEGSYRYIDKAVISSIKRQCLINRKNNTYIKK